MGVFRPVCPSGHHNLMNLKDYWRRRRDSNPGYRFWPVCSLSRGVPSTTRPRLRNSGNRHGRCVRVTTSVDQRLSTPSTAKQVILQVGRFQRYPASSEPRRLDALLELERLVQHAYGKLEV